ncbi:cupin domain-containing protein [Pseudomaricurvus sp. HS19]|uniref:cupin domain-containing protein n=1 Tax=Pseudomaricurvus sp. HS19 TaxID=2692626 RepID=UPI0013714E45|nr:cupin domain-containing protein [Pseudomaricurvus sp. HS19]MYM64534.1 cupin domain-containing protein [Pseudomaricurvus sp. HS19]
MTDNNKPLRFATFRHADADPAAGIPIMEMTPLSDVAMEGAMQLTAAGVESGHENRLLFSGGGFSLLYAWFKSGYPLPRHTHNCDCLYYITGGSVLMGNDELHAGDGFFVGEDVPYTYVAGARGVEILEFRASERFDIKVLADNPQFWARALQTVADKQTTWADEPRPGANNQE